MLIHLRMTGAVLTGSAAAVDTHRRAVVTLDDGSEVAYRDVRRFGTWLLLEPAEVDPYIDARVGSEPLAPSYKARDLAAKLAGRRAPVKAALLDQRTVAGIGNIYADEALWRARIHPLTPAAALDPEEVKALHRAVRTALRAGIARQGSTLRDYRLPDGASGSMQDEFKVYGRGGEPCERCGTPIDKIRVAGRGTWYCPHCQRTPRLANSRLAEVAGRTHKTRGDRPALVPLLGGRPDPPPLHRRTGDGRRDRQGRAQDQVAVRRTPRAALARRADAARGKRRAADDHRRRVAPLAPSDP